METPKGIIGQVAVEGEVDGGGTGTSERYECWVHWRQAEASGGRARAGLGDEGDRRGRTGTAERVVSYVSSFGGRGGRLFLAFILSFLLFLCLAGSGSRR